MAMSPVRMFGEQDADPARLKGKRVAIIGYGSQGHAHALNLRDSGVDVVVGLRAGGRSAEAARAATFDVREVADAAAVGDLVALLVPDTTQAALYRDHIAPRMNKGATLLFAHGFNIHYDQIKPPADADVVLVAPKSPGHMVRREYAAGRGVPALVGVHQDASGHALDTALAYAAAIGCTRAGVLETTFAAETESDLFGEQAVLCGGVSELIKAGFETLVEGGYPPELAYFECLHEMKLIVDLVYAGGLTGMRQGVSDTAEYGDYVSGPRVIGAAARQAMKDVLVDIKSGAFARRWIAEAAAGGKEFQRLRERDRRHPIEETGKQLRARMAWLAGD
jgi:ketol-acid reductoisomerase